MEIRHTLLKTSRPADYIIVNEAGGFNNRAIVNEAGGFNNRVEEELFWK